MEHATLQSTMVPQNCSFSQQGYTSDPVMFVDGHYVGHDGFVVPKDFPEFYVRFPQHIRRWVRRHADKSALKEDIEDWTQDLCAHMSSLPATSKHREAGMQDVIQTFDPFRHYGANLARFLNYVNHCLGNKFRTIHSGRTKSPLCRAKRLSPPEIGEVASTDDASCRVLSERAKEVALFFSKTGGRQAPDRRVHRFRTKRKPTNSARAGSDCCDRHAGRGRAKTRNDDRRLQTPLPPTARVGAFLPQSKNETAATEALGNTVRKRDKRFRL
jgi:hypothetical protein